MPIIVDPAGAGVAPARRVSLGPLALPTLVGDLKETVGEQLETIGAGVVAGERRPRPFPLSIPIHGAPEDLALRFVVGNRLRRQVRALMENSAARLEGLYLAFSPDPELNGWLLVGGGDLVYGQGAIALADYRLELTDCYKVANLRTHRPARRLVAIDRRLATTPRDTLERVFSVEFAAQAATARHYLPVGTSDQVSGATRQPVNPTALVTADGQLGYLQGSVHGDIIDFEQSEGDIHRAGVQIVDRRGSAVETDWDQIYGPDQFPTPDMPNDIPVIENAVCRLVTNPIGAICDVQWRETNAWVTGVTFAPPAGTTGVRASVVEWTPERGVLLIHGVIGSPATTRVQMYVTLQRGWAGPRVEVYTNAAFATSATLQVYPVAAGDTTVERSSGVVSITSGEEIGFFTGLAPWAKLLPPPSGPSIHLAVLQEAALLTGLDVAGREGVTVAGPGTYVSVQIELAARSASGGAGAVLAAAHGARGLIDARTVPELVGR